MLLALAVLTYSVKNAIILFVLALLISLIGIPMITVGVMAMLNKEVYLMRFRAGLLEFNNTKTMLTAQIPHVSLVFFAMRTETIY